MIVDVDVNRLHIITYLVQYSTAVRPAAADSFQSDHSDDRTSTPILRSFSRIYRIN